MRLLGHLLGISLCLFCEEAVGQPTCDVACLKINLPNIITPNGDGINDSLLFIQLDSCQCEIEVQDIRIYNRWGGLVFCNILAENGVVWSGLTNEGDEVSTGVYFYLVHITLRDDISKYTISKGWVHVLR